MAKFTGKHLCRSLFFNKVAGLRPASLLKKRLQHRCFPVKFAKFLKTPFLQSIPGGCFCIVKLQLLFPGLVWTKLYFPEKKGNLHQRALCFLIHDWRSSHEGLLNSLESFNKRQMFCSRAVGSFHLIGGWIMFLRPNVLNFFILIEIFKNLTIFQHFDTFVNAETFQTIWTSKVRLYS